MSCGPGVPVRRNPPRCVKFQRSSLIGALGFDCACPHGPRTRADQPNWRPGRGSLDTRAEREARGIAPCSGQMSKYVPTLLPAQETIRGFDIEDSRVRLPLCAPTWGLASWPAFCRRWIARSDERPRLNVVAVSPNGQISRHRVLSPFEGGQLGTENVATTRILSPVDSIARLSGPPPREYSTWQQGRVSANNVPSP